MRYLFFVLVAIVLCIYSVSGEMPHNEKQTEKRTEKYIWPTCDEVDEYTGNCYRKNVIIANCYDNDCLDKNGNSIILIRSEPHWIEEENGGLYSDPVPCSDYCGTCWHVQTSNGEKCYMRSESWERMPAGEAK